MASKSTDNKDFSRTVKLTKREIEVLGLVGEGKSSAEVATELFCSKRTVDFHLTRIYEKLNVSNRVQAMRRATSLGLINLDLIIGENKSFKTKKT
ncbi:MAG: helix-turn-helix transcriptional regulator [Armatimonadota bacterium]